MELGVATAVWVRVRVVEVVVMRGWTVAPKLRVRNVACRSRESAANFISSSRIVSAGTLESERCRSSLVVMGAPARISSHAASECP